MALLIHVVYVTPRQVNAAGTVIDKRTASVGEALNSSTEPRVIADSAIANSANNPTVKRYLELEAAADYRLQYMDQGMIVTYHT